MSTPTVTSDPVLEQEVSEIATSIEAIQTLLAGVLSPRQLSSANEKYLSGQWPRRNGTTYAPVVPVQQAPGALVK